MRRVRRPPAEAAPVRLLLPVAIALLLPACAGGEHGAGASTSDSVYVEVMARLVLLDSAMTRPAEVSLPGLDRDSARRDVLERFDVDARDLLEYAEERGRSPSAMAEVWRRIRELADSLEAVGWRPGSGGEGPPPADSIPPGSAP